LLSFPLSLSALTVRPRASRAKWKVKLDDGLAPTTLGAPAPSNRPDVFGQTKNENPNEEAEGALSSAALGETPARPTTLGPGVRSPTTAGEARRETTMRRAAPPPVGDDACTIGF